MNKNTEKIGVKACLKKELKNKRVYENTWKNKEKTDPRIYICTLQYTINRTYSSKMDLPSSFINYIEKKFSQIYS